MRRRMEDDRKSEGEVLVANRRDRRKEYGGRKIEGGSATLVNAREGKE